MKKGMIIELKDGEHSYEYGKMNWMKYKGGNLIISYQDENDEERIETGSAPDEIIFHPYHVEEKGRRS